MSQPDIEQFFLEHGESVYRFIFYRVRHQQTAEDLMSQVFEKVLKNVDSFSEQPGANFRSWVFSITRNTITDHFRKKKLPQIPVEMVDVFEESTIEENIADAEALSRVFALVDELPERRREIVLLRFKADLSNKEIAEVLDMTQSAVSSAISKALTQLRDAIASSDETSHL